MIKKICIYICMTLLFLKIFPFITWQCYAMEYEGISYVSGGDVIHETDIDDGEEEKIILPKELDLGDYQTEMTVGERQLLMITVLPEDTTNKEVAYVSSNTSVATVNGMGRITAVSLGETMISVSCGDIQSSFPLKVVEDASKKQVRDIEISDYEEELNVESVLRLNATVLPADATDATIIYSSSDNSIATVNSSGEVKGISAGKVIICISAGGIKKQIELTVKIGTTGIDLNSDYLVLKPEDVFQLETEIRPKGASNKITYKSLDTKVATVSKDGLVTAVQCGNTAIIISNGDMQVSATVMVNAEGYIGGESSLGEGVIGQENCHFQDEILASQYPVISSKMLKYFYENEKVLTVKGEGYTIFLDGEDIVNVQNELNTIISFQQMEEGISFVINEGHKLCGQFVLDISSKIGTEKYLYLFNEATQNYEKLAVDDMGLLTIDSEGTYLISAKELSGLTWNKLFWGIGIVVILVGGCGYVAVKKQYWFW